MKKIDSFINCYPLSKTLQFSLIPYGKTEENFIASGFLEDDQDRDSEYKVVKKLIDRYHKAFIDSVLTSIEPLDITEYAQLFYKSGKTDSEKKKMAELEAAYRKTIAKALTGDVEYKKLFSKEIITEILPVFLTDKNELESVGKFKNFYTYFGEFNKNRENMYSDEEKSTAIAYRCINESLPKFLDNARVFLKITDKIDIESLDRELEGIVGRKAKEIFGINNFTFVLSSHGIDAYNSIIGGYTTSDGKKIQGLNELVNLYNQKQPKSDRIPQMKMLYKQILADRESVSFIPEAFESDDELLEAVNSYYIEIASGVAENIQVLFSELDSFDPEGIYLRNGPALTDFSNKALGSWDIIRNLWNDEYDSGANIKNYEKHIENRDKQWKKTDSFSLAQLQKYMDCCKDTKADNVSGYFTVSVSELVQMVQKAYSECESILKTPYVREKRLAKNDKDIELIKNLLDALKNLERFLKPLSGTGKEDGRSMDFYGLFDEYYSKLHELDKLYDKVRNHITKKPYSKNKIKLNFSNPQFLNGWDRNKESDYRTVLLKRGEKIYLAIIDKSNSKLFENYPTDNSNGWQKIIYKLLPGPNKMLPKVIFAKSNIDYYAPSEEILRIYKGETFKKGANFSISDCRKLIDFYKDAISRTTSWSDFDFNFRNTDEYEDIVGFYRDVEKQGYKIKYSNISEQFIEENIANGNIYLFQIYSKDFSEYSKGTPNLHTLYFKMLFDERNLRDVVYQLNGGAEMFYRFPSLKLSETTVHPKNQPVKNKNPDAMKKESVFEYDLIKDRRFTKPQFSLHIPIKLNFKANGSEYINAQVRKVLKDSDDNYVIGIDRGERHLLYITVVNQHGEIVEQFSANEIISGKEGNEHKVDYHKLLSEKEAKRLEARQSWGTIETIKELKEGYISQIVHKICELVIKYDAVIAMEDLNSGFKNSRVKVEKQVYQKFEKMLIDKLNYYVNKSLSPEENGGLLHAYQLTEKFQSFEKMGLQNGFIFYVPAWLTSKIDPSTGFVDLLKPKYTSADASVDFFKRFDNIRYNESEKYFEFVIDYKNFPKGSTDYKSKWTICTYGTRIKTERSKDANGNYVSAEVNLTDELIRLFEAFGIDYRSGDLHTLILARKEKDFFEKLIKLLSLTLQMRNSITGTAVDYLISPVKNSEGIFYDSRNYDDLSVMPANADANGAYNIARKALWAIDVLKSTPDEDLGKAKLSIKNKDWLCYAQK